MKYVEGVNKLFERRAGALVKWLWEETHGQKVVSSNTGTVYSMNIFHMHLLKLSLFEKTENKWKKEVGVGPFKKTI